ncbi:MAG: electron transfer flavoprotein subunit alpha/FixB family protein [Spirochaetota bacterium]
MGSRDIVVYFEYHHEVIQPIGFQLLAKAYELSGYNRQAVYGIVIGEKTEQARKQLTGQPLERVYLYETDDFFTADSREKLVTECILELNPAVVLFGGTKEGKSISSRAAAALRTGLTADCTELYMRGEDELVQVRPAYGGNIIAQIGTKHARPQMASVSFNLLAPLKADFGGHTEFCTRHPESRYTSKIELLEAQKIPVERGITEQDVIVAVGLGVKQKEDLDMLAQLADLLGGALASTRGLVEKGWMPHSRQIGLSGQSIRVKLLITCGVSGTVQFLAGVQRADTLIAVNTDRQARICSVADYAFCGDLYDIVPMLIKRLQGEQS